MTALKEAPRVHDTTPVHSRASHFVRANLDSLRLLLTVAALWVVLAILSPNFLTTSNITNVVVNAAPMALAAAGLTLVIIAGDLDLSVGSAMALVSTCTALLMASWDVPWVLALFAGVLIGGLCGLVNGLLSSGLAIPSFIATLAMMSALRGLALVASDGQAVTGVPDAVTDLARASFLGISTVIWVPLIVIPCLAFLLNRTSFGLNVFAIGGNREAAKIAGVPIRRTRLLVLSISGLMAGFAGVISTARLGVGSPIIAEDLILDAIAAVVIGGTSLFGGVGRMFGTVLGVILIATIRNGLVLMDVSAFYQKLAIGVVILLAAGLDALGNRRDG